MRNEKGKNHSGCGERDLEGVQEARNRQGSENLRTPGNGRQGICQKEQEKIE